MSEAKVYTTIAAEVSFEDVIKNSTFIGTVMPVDDIEAAQDWLEHIRTRYNDASHNCWAYVMADVYRFSDDGEPGGTAGRPMLEVLQRRNLDRLAAVVTRYYGGTKLGTGGLVRAYSGTLAKTLDQAEVVTVRPRVQVAVHVPFTEMDAVHRFLDSWHDLHKAEPTFDAEGMIVVVTILADDADGLALELKNVTRGSVKISKIAD
ncbi:MAG: YigZ family protein [Deinococcota bacterium]